MSNPLSPLGYGKYEFGDRVVFQWSGIGEYYTVVPPCVYREDRLQALPRNTLAMRESEGSRRCFYANPQSVVSLQKRTDIPIINAGLSEVGDSSVS